MKPSPAVSAPDKQGFGLVMRDVNGGDADFLLKSHELYPHMLAQLGVEV